MGYVTGVRRRLPNCNVVPTITELSEVFGGADLYGYLTRVSIEFQGQLLVSTDRVLLHVEYGGTTFSTIQYNTGVAPSMGTVLVGPSGVLAAYNSSPLTESGHILEVKGQVFNDLFGAVVGGYNLIIEVCETVSAPIPVYIRGDVPETYFFETTWVRNAYQNPEVNDLNLEMYVARANRTEVLAYANSITKIEVRLASTGVLIHTINSPMFAEVPGSSAMIGLGTGILFGESTGTGSFTTDLFNQAYEKSIDVTIFSPIENITTTYFIGVLSTAGRLFTEQPRMYIEPPNSTVEIYNIPSCMSPVFPTGGLVVQPNMSGGGDYMDGGNIESVLTSNGVVLATFRCNYEATTSNVCNEAIPLLPGEYNTSPGTPCIVGKYQKQGGLQSTGYIAYIEDTIEVGFSNTITMTITVTRNPTLYTAADVYTLTSVGKIVAF